MKCKCGNDTYYITIMGECGDCENNGAWTEDGYIYDASIIEDFLLTRSESYEEGQCGLGNSWDFGCYMFKCSECDSITHLGMSEG